MADYFFNFSSKYSCFNCFLNIRKSKTTPIDYVVNGINNNDINSILKAYHPYCALSMECIFSEEKLNDYHNSVIQNFGSNAKISYKVIGSEKMSADDIESYYENAIFTYSDYPYLQENEMEFDTIYKINTEFYIKGKNGKDSSRLE